MNNTPPNNLDVASIAPQLASSFSPNLYRYMRKQRSFARYITVFRSSEDSTLWLGCIWDGDFIGARLMQVLCHGSRTPTGCYSSLTPTLREVPGFWEQYLRLGRCAIDPEHRLSFTDDRWVQQGFSRKCLWCGHQQQLKVWSEPVQKSRWESLQHAAAVS